MNFEFGPAKNEGNQQSGIEGVRDAMAPRLLALAERNSWSIEALSALEALLQAEPEDGKIPELIGLLPTSDGIRDRALQILCELPTFAERSHEVIAKANSFDQLATSLKEVVGIVGSDGRFYPGTLLSDIVREVGENIITYALNNSMESVDENNFKNPDFLLTVGYQDFSTEKPLIPTSGLGLRQKFLELVNREIFERDMKAVEDEFKKLDQ